MKFFSEFLGLTEAQMKFCSKLYEKYKEDLDDFTLCDLAETYEDCTYYIGSLDSLMVDIIFNSQCDIEFEDFEENDYSQLRDLIKTHSISIIGLNKDNINDFNKLFKEIDDLYLECCGYSQIKSTKTSKNASKPRRR